MFKKFKKFLLALTITVITMCFNCYGGNCLYSEDHFIKRDHINSYYYSPLRHRYKHIEHTRRPKVKIKKLMLKLYKNIVQLPYNTPIKRTLRVLLKQIKNGDIDMRIKYFYRSNTIKYYIRN